MAKSIMERALGVRDAYQACRSAEEILRVRNRTTDLIRAIRHEPDDLIAHRAATIIQDAYWAAYLNCGHKRASVPS